MRSLIVFGGRLKVVAGGLHRASGALFEHGIVAEVDLETGAVRRRLKWVDPEWSDVSQVIKGGHWYGEQLLLCTERNLLWVDPVEWKVVNHWSHPAMNDVHDVAWLDDRLWIACSGLDAVLEVRSDGEVVAHGLERKLRLPEKDLRTQDLAPNHSHPASLFWWEGKVWVTRFQHRDAVPVVGGRATGHLSLGAWPVHDGLPTPWGVYFTSVDGRLLLTGRAGLHAVPLEAPDKKAEPLGWCRGVHVYGDEAWVGFSRIRNTRFREHLAWVGDRLQGTLFESRRPTRLQRHSRHTGALHDTIDLEPVGIDAVYGVLPGPVEA